jgi:hypothetical protein
MYFAIDASLQIFSSSSLFYLSANRYCTKVIYLFIYLFKVIISGTGAATCTVLIAAITMKRWIVVLGCLRSQCTKFYSLRPFIWSRVSGLMQFHDGPTASVHGILFRSLNKCYRNPDNDYTAFGEQSMNRTWKVKTHLDRKGETGEEQIHEHANLCQ